MSAIGMNTKGMKTTGMKTLRTLALTLALTLIVGVAGVTPAWAKPKEEIFIPPKEKILEPFTNDKCLKNCHGEKNLYSASITGEKVSLHVDVKGFILSTHGQKGIACIDCHVGADPNSHPRTGYPIPDCRACHSAKPGSELYPPNALEALKAKGIKPPPNRSLQGEVWMKTKHAWAWSEGKPGAPFCSDCHTAHYVKKAYDPSSKVNSANIVATCTKCHVAQKTGLKEVGQGLAGLRIAGHGKADISTRYAADQCLSCHQGEGAHGEKELRDVGCPNCHNAKSDRKFHLLTAFDEEGPSAVLAVFYSILFWGGAILIGFILLFFGFTNIYRADDES
jgi:nitrate reductase cytochrome c-type subunit